MEKRLPVDVRLAKDIAELGMRAGLEFALLAKQAVKEKGVFTVALSGGNTPRYLFEALTTPPLVHEIPWAQIQFFFSDERYVPHDDPMSNYDLAKRYLFQKVPVKEENVFAVPTGHADPKVAAALYQKTIEQVLGVHHAVGFDLIYLGLGSDGHTASLFPGTDVVEGIVKGTYDKHIKVAATWVEKAGMFRVTFTPALINQAHAVHFLIAGADKAPKLHQFIWGPEDPLDCPVQLIAPSQGQVLVFADAAAVKA